MLLCYALYQSRKSNENVQTMRKNRIQIRNTALFFIAWTHQHSVDTLLTTTTRHYQLSLIHI